MVAPKRKDGMLKKHDPKKEEREREGGNHVSKKREVGMIQR